MKNIKFINKIIVVCSVLFLSACMKQPQLVNDLYLNIDKPLPVYQGSSRSFFQNGISVPQNRLDSYKPFCAISTNSVAQSNVLEISPQKIQISSIYSDYHTYGDFYFPGIKKTRKRLSDWNGPYTLRSTFEFSSPNKQQLTHIRCSLLSGDGYDYHLDVADVNKILGSNGQLIRQP